VLAVRLYSETLSYLVRLHFRVILSIAHGHVADKLSQHGSIAPPLQRSHVSTLEPVLVMCLRYGGRDGGFGSVAIVVMTIGVVVDVVLFTVTPFRTATRANGTSGAGVCIARTGGAIVLTQSMRELARSKWKLSGAETVRLAFFRDAMIPLNHSTTHWC